jgi:MurNAc alpha-1-phosphate uridylyltransferase
VQAVIVAGGLATRMRPQTLELPKSLIPVGGRPFITWQLEKIAGSGFSHVLLCIGHLGHAIREFVGDGSGFGLRVDYSEESENLLGTAGALRRAISQLGETFLVTYGDSYLPFDYSAPLRDLCAHPEAQGTMAVFRNQGRWEKSNTAIEGDRVLRYDKSSRDPTLDYIDCGATALRREVVAALTPDQPLGLDSVQADLARRGLLRAWRARERFYEIGSEEGLRDLDHLLGGKA